MNQRRLIEVTSLLVLLASSTLLVQAQESAKNDQMVGIYHAKNAPALDLGKAVISLLGPGADGPPKGTPVIVSEPISNSVMVRGEAKAVKQIHEMLKELDRKPASVFVEVAIVTIQSDKEPARIAVRGDGGNSADEIIDALSAQGDLQVLARAQLMALNNQAAFVQIGSRKPRITGVRESSAGRARSVELENVGLTLGLTARITEDGTVAMELDLERSDLGRDEDGVEISSSGDRVADVTTFSLQTTVSATSGRTVVLGGMTEGTDGKWQKTLALLTPTVVP